MARTPDTVSAGWQAFYATAPGATEVPATPAPGDHEGWARTQAIVDAPMLLATTAALEQFGGRVVERLLGGVAVIEVRPAVAGPRGHAIIYLHGGAYTLYSARARLTSVLPIVKGTGFPVIAVDYTLAPKARWPQAIKETVAVITALAAEGIDSVAIYGDSAGGALALAVTLRLRSIGLPMPKALALWSPWADIAAVGDTYATLVEADVSFRYDLHLANAALAYADERDHRNPEVSPVYADFAKGFPPTLIQGGTREIFLSNFVRLYRALVDAGQYAVLDLYEGMPHAFQAYPLQMSSPESKTAIGATASFLSKYLGNVV